MLCRDIYPVEAVDTSPSSCFFAEWTKLSFLQLYHQEYPERQQDSAEFDQGREQKNPYVIDKPANLL